MGDSVARIYSTSELYVNAIAGDWVKQSDYLALQAALREALDGWEFWHGDIGPQQERISELRKFLDDK